MSLLLSSLPLPLLIFLLPLCSIARPLIVTPRMVDVVHIIDDYRNDDVELQFQESFKPTTTTTTTEKPKEEEKEEGKSEWPSGDYCIFSGSSGNCPENFAHGSIQLAVPVNIGIGEMYRNGNELENYVKVGRVGGVELSMLPYEQIYSLKLSACCRVETPKTTTSTPITEIPQPFKA
ncbi:hypothetical protein PRIPAC_88498 [Pristionchus pacificus]|uniref:ApeC domain-containing protein n=1 Tax=Pristionchus pacificus TaxID=54126 RepID=A0A2A6CUT0_PRIPA|nr:hypothetical protein PRIPAC_88498 [Pristionchus pacificus]|eukprot:PDM81994.1 hypothetical protein PRIPAC_36387 [Pristionchus pacificus]